MSSLIQRGRWPGRYTAASPMLPVIAAKAEQLLPSLLEVQSGRAFLNAVVDHLQSRCGEGDAWLVEDPESRAHRFRFHIAGRCGNYLIQDIGFHDALVSLYRKGDLRLMAPPTALHTWRGHTTGTPSFESSLSMPELIAVGEQLCSALYGRSVQLPTNSKSLAVPLPTGQFLAGDEIERFSINSSVADRVLYIAAMVWRFGPIRWDSDWCNRWSFDPTAASEPPLSVGGTVEGVPYPTR